VELTTKFRLWRQYFLRNKHRWFSGICCIVVLQREGNMYAPGYGGSIPGRCKPIFAPSSAHNWSTFSILGHFVNVIFAMLVLKQRTSDTKIQGSCPVTILKIMSVNCQRCEQSVGCHLNFLIKCLSYKNGEAGYRSLYPSHAKRILYHLSYIPCDTAL
jgi:hypothetical protein